MDRDISVDVRGVPAEVIDHSEEFVALVHQSAPDVYRKLLDSARIGDLLASTNRFNYGKVYAYAEYLVFRAEFLRRFPDASAPECINSFSGLLLKNDISISNLVHFMEQSPAAEIEQLNTETYKRLEE
jgi:hypothetical protein